MTPCATILGYAVLFLATTASAASTAPIHVLPNGTGGYATIQDAIDAAVSGDEIILGDGTFLGPRNRDLLFLGKNLTLRSQGGDPVLCTLDCEGQSRGINITQGETAVVVEGITIRNGYSPGQGGIPGAPGWGGGVNLSNATVTIRNCVITLCSANDGPGAAIGAGAYAVNSRVTFEDCAFIQNSFALRGTGAGLFAWGNSNVTATRCKFFGNRAPGISSGGSGGGIRVQDSRLTLVDCEVVGNMADIGAGISTGQLCLVDFRNCLVAGNSNDTAQGSAQAAGIQFGYDTDGSVESCTIVGNRAYNRGAGISVANDCNLTFTKTIIRGNCIGTGQGESAYLLSLGAVDFLCCDVDPATVFGGMFTYTNSLAVDPQFCAPEPCASAPTLAGTYTLDGNSPVLNAPGCGLIGRSGAGCGTVGIPLPPAVADALRIRCAPNPFQGSALLQYSIPEAGRVEVGVYDVAGRLIVRFDEGPKQRGAHTIPWDGISRTGSRVPPGAYFARVRSGGLVAGDWIVRVD